MLPITLMLKRRSYFSVRIWSTASLILFWGILLLTAGKGFAHEGEHPDSETPSSPFSGVSVNGKMTYPDGSPVSKDDIQFQWIVDGSDLFAHGVGNCPRTASHMTGTKIQSGETGTDGTYSVNLGPNEIHSVASPSCSTGALNLGQVQEIRLRATVLANPNTCQNYCKTQNESLDSCVQRCSTGQRILEGTTKISQSDLKAAAPTPPQAPAGIARPLEIGRLGPPLSEAIGVDLRIDGSAAENSFQQVEEEFPAGDCAVQEACVRAPGKRKLLRFDGVIDNVGSSDLNIGDPRSNPLFEMDACHGHEHAKGMVLHQLLHPGTLDPVRIQGREIVGYKQGFCFMDTAPINATNADAGKFTCDNQGISAGWSDIYSADLECQYLDITDVTPGNYILRLTVNPEGVLEEANPNNNTADIPVSIQ